MRTIYLDCGMGCAGDMLTAALVEVAGNREECLDILNSMAIPHVKYIAEDSVKCGIKGTHISVQIDGEEEGDCGCCHDHHHTDLEDIRSIAGKLNAPDEVKKGVIAVYEMIAAAESKVHGVKVEEIHFHEVGAMDAVADVAAVCMLINRINPDRIVASPVHTGKGTVRCAHGILPVPAPATAELLTGVPVYSTEIDGELCTPTGAALLKYLVSAFGDMPVMIPEKTGYGMGKKDFSRANCVRAILGDTPTGCNTVSEFMCNIDDMTAEEIGFAQEMLFEAGAVEVYTVAVGMKKSRPGTLLCVMCPENRKKDVLECIFRHTTTIGIREKVCNRYTLERKTDTVETPLGSIRKKTVGGFGVTRHKYEFDDCAAIAKREGMTLRDVRKTAEESDKNR